MQIQQAENGNIIIKDRNGRFTHILSSMSVQRHPRKDNALVIYSSDIQDKKGIEFLANQRIYINNKPRQLTAETLLKVLSTEIVLGGANSSTETKPKRKEEDPNYVAFLQANTYEKLLAFVKKHNKRVGGKNIQNGKLIEEEFYCQFHTFTIIVSLRYHYKTSNPNLIDYILIWGSTQYVTKPKKVYVYDRNNAITGYIYKEIYED